MKAPRLRGQRPRREAPYDLGQLTAKFLRKFGRLIVHRIAIGLGDLSGDDVGTMFADAIGGVHRAKPLGVADVQWNGCAWTVKTVKSPNPFLATRVRLISGRCSPDYSMGIENPHEDPQRTGEAVLSIWNARVDEALNEHRELRTFVLVRNVEAREFVVFEDETVRYVRNDYVWQFNNKGNLEGYDRSSRQHRFTWQPHGSQFTIVRAIPGSARKFSIIANVPRLSANTVLKSVGFRPDWIRIDA